MQSTMTFRRYMVLLAVMLTASIGDTFLSKGMKQAGPVSVHNLFALILALKDPWVLAGIVLLIGFFASYLTSLSWADLTFVLPATAFGYVIIPLLSHFWLHEYISPARWGGILLITLGVGFVTQGPSYTQHSEESQQEEISAAAEPSAQGSREPRA